MSEIRSFIDNAETRLNKLADDLEELDAKASDASAEAKATIRQQADAVRKPWSDAKTHLAEIVEAQQDNLEAVKATAERHWNAVKDAIQTYRNRVGE